MKTERRALAVDDGTELGVYVATPDAQPRGAIIVLQEIFGINAHIRDVTERFAREGYLAAAPDLFHRIEPWWEGSYGDLQPGVQKAMATSQDHIRADLRATHKLLTDVERHKVGSVGFCMGGRQSYVANGILPLACAVSFYGSNIVGLPDLATSQSGPLLLLWGGLDKGIDKNQRRAVADLLEGASKPFVEANFSSAQHGFFCDQRSQYHEPSAKQAWSLVKAFLAEHLG
jgi:carboxymethylenebutenolidase